jgi:hypothetical protein
VIFVYFTVAFIAVALVTAFVVAIVARFWTRRTDTLVLRGVAPDKANALIGDFLQSLDDDRIGFPTGVFYIDEKHTAPGRVVAREADFKGSSGFRLARLAFTLPIICAAAALEVSWVAALIAFFVAFVVTVYIAIPILLLALAEVALRALMRGRVVAHITPREGPEEGSAVMFELRGLAALAIEPQLNRAFRRPQLPVALRSLAPGAATAPDLPPQRDRLRSILLAAGASAALTALVLALTVPANIPDLGGDTSVARDSNDPGSSDGDEADSDILDGSSSGAGDSPSGDENTNPALTDRSVARSEIRALIRDEHEAIVDGDFESAWDLLSRRKQAQYERRPGGYQAWAEAQGTLSPYLDPSGARIQLLSLNENSRVATFRVKGMTWSKPGANCSSWSGITWAKYEGGQWKYDPGYSTTPARERVWKPRFERLLGGLC